MLRITWHTAGAQYILVNECEMPRLSSSLHNVDKNLGVLSQTAPSYIIVYFVFFYYYYFLNLFILFSFGCIGSSLLRAGFL